MFLIRGLHAYHGDAHVLHDIDLTIAERRFTALIGPNGSGKSTLLGTMSGLIRAQQGELLLAGMPVSSYSKRDLARRISFLPQQVQIPAAMNLRELLVQGRFPWRNWLGGWTVSDEEAVTRAARLCDVEALLDRPLESLSGGQLQRAWIAMTLAQDAPIILLDEPTTFLDVANQLSLLDLLAGLRDAGRTVIAILHDLNQAARYADILVMMRDGRIVAEGETAQIFNNENIEQVFGVRSRMLIDHETGEAICIPSSRSA
jgi:iron complex transport system ATP-binding protein